MNENTLALLFLLGIGGIVLLIAKSQPVAAPMVMIAAPQAIAPTPSAAPIAVYQNEETYEIKRDANGRATGLVIHRNAQVQ